MKQFLPLKVFEFCIFNFAFNKRSLLRTLNFEFNRFCLLALFILNLTFAFVPTNANANQGLYINRTEHVDGNGTNDIEQFGGAVKLRFRPDDSAVQEEKTFAFWLKRDIAKDSLSGDPQRSPNGNTTFIHIFSDDKGDTADIKISNSVITYDDVWHYCLLHISTTNESYDVDFYIDGNSTPVASFQDEEARGVEIFIGSEFEDGPGADKLSTDSNFILDDIATWSGFPSDILEQFSEVYDLGMVRFDYSHEALESVVDFDSSFSITYIEETGVSSFTPSIDITLNEYDFDRGADISLANFVDTSEIRNSRILVTINSEYGVNEVIPNSVSGGVLYNLDTTETETITFSAPAYVYLDRYGNELGSSDDDTSFFIDDAYYRARNTGYVVNGVRSDTSGTTTRLFTQSQTEDLTVTWVWELDYAVIVEMATGNAEGLSDSLGNPLLSGVSEEAQNSLGKKWVPANTLVTAAIDGIIFAENNLGIGAGPTRFTSTGYILENAPVADATTVSGHYAYFELEDGYLDGGNLEPGLVDDGDTSTDSSLTNSDLTIEFWARLDPSDATTDQDIVSFGVGSLGEEQIRVGFRDNSEDLKFFALANTNGSSLAQLDGPTYTDYQWHHWAVVYDHDDSGGGNGSVVIYRDGEEIFSEDGKNLVFNGNSNLIIGGSPTNIRGEYKIRHFFPGGINNVRVWKTVRDQSQVQESMITQEYGSGLSDLFLELTFDAPALSGITSTEGSGYAFDYENTDSMFESETSDADRLAVLFPDYTYIQGDADRYVQFDSDRGWIDSESAIGYSSGDLTVEFWARLDDKTSNSESRVLSLRTAQSANSQIDFILDNDEFRVDGYPEVYASASSNFIDNDWHHWAFVYDSANSQTTLYRDGEEVGSQAAGDFGSHNGDNIVTLGALPTGLSPFSGGINNVRVWNASRTEVQLLESMKTREYGNQTDLLLELTFDELDGFGYRIRSTEGNDFVFNYQDAETLLSSKSATSSAVLFPTFENFQFGQADSRVSTDEYPITDWLRVSWQWQKEYRLRLVYQSGEAGVDAVTFAPFPFVEGEHVYQDSNRDYWAKALSEVTVGTQYRTNDRCYTFKELTGQLYAFSAVTENSLVDGERSGQATRQYTFDELPGGGKVVFNYARTLHRAYIPLGEGLDVSAAADLENDPFGQIFPNLCEDGELSLNASGPTIALAKPSTQGGGAEMFKWDAVGQQLLPLQPGVFQVDWPDANDPSKSYLIEVVSGLPTTEESFSWDLEDDSGFRLDANDARIITSGLEAADSVTLDPVSDAFVASPAAHYRHLFSPTNNKNPPTNVDDNSSDRWHFHEVTFSENLGRVDQSNVFNVDEVGKSVLLYSYRPDATQTANGDESKEAFVTRVVDSTNVEDNVIPDSVVSSNNRRMFYSGDTAPYLVKFDNAGGSFSLGTDTPRTLAFWVKLDELPESINDRYVYNGEFSNDNFNLRIGFRSPNDNANPNNFFIEFYNTETANVDESFILTDFNVTNDWNHWAIVFNEISGHIKIYANGLLVASSLSFPAGFGEFSSNTNEHYFCGVPGENSRLLNGSIDNIDWLTLALSAEQIRDLYKGSFPDDNNGYQVKLTFDTDNNNSLENEGSNSTGFSFYSVSDVSTSLSDPLSDLLLDQTADFFPEVATRITSKLDNAEFGSGYLVNAVSNINAQLYNRDEVQVGAWGPVFPVNWSGIFSDNNALELVYYENPFIAQSQSDPATGTLHPNVAWPYIAVNYDSVDFPTYGEHKDKRIYISSRLGTEGVDVEGSDQTLFDPARYANLAVYNQPDPSAPGYNPNEEHALVAPSIKAGLLKDSSFNFGQDAAFALQQNLNRTVRFTGENDINSSNNFTSEPWVLVQYQDLELGESGMAAYRVEITRVGDTIFPRLDPDTNDVIDALGQPVDQSFSPTYDFYYPYFSGDILVPPYPLNLVIGATILSEQKGGNLENADGLMQRTIWNDINDNTWVVSGDGFFFYRYWYPMRSDFWYETGTPNGQNDINLGTPIAWLPEQNENGGYEFLDSVETESVTVDYHTYWRSDYPTLKRGETLTYAGGEYFDENIGAEGLPGVLAWAAGQVVYDSDNPSMKYTDGNLDNYSARFIRPLDRYEAAFEQSNLPEVLTPAFTDNVMVDGSRYYFLGLTGSLQKRFYYDTLTSKLVFRGRLNDLESGDPDLTATPVSLYILEPNVMTATEYSAIVDDLLKDELGLVGTEPIFAAVESIYEESQNPSLLETSAGIGVTANPADDDSGNYMGHVFLSGVEQSDFTTENANGELYLFSQPLFYDKDNKVVSETYAPNPSIAGEDLVIDTTVGNDGTYSWILSERGTDMYYATAPNLRDPSEDFILTDTDGTFNISLSSEKYNWNNLINFEEGDGSSQVYDAIFKNSLDPDDSPTIYTGITKDEIELNLNSNGDAYEWEKSLSGTNEYYLVASGGGDPGIDEINEVTESNRVSQNYSPGSLGYLKINNFAWGDNDNLGFETIYIRTSRNPLLAKNDSESGKLLMNGDEIERYQKRSILSDFQWRLAEVCVPGSISDKFTSIIIRLPLDPGISNPTSVEYANTALVKKDTLDSLELGEYAYGDEDNLGFSTVYVRLPVERLELSDLDPTSPVTIDALEDLYGKHQTLNSLGTGGALVPNPKLLTSSSDEPQYVTLFENNNVDAGGAVAVHVIEIGEQRYRGAIKLVEAQNVFDEKINLQHTGEFGGNTEDVYYQWFVREVDSLQKVGLPAEDSSSINYDPEWQIYAEGLGLHKIAFKGRPDITLADKFFHVRYGEKAEINAAADASGAGLGNDVDVATVSDNTWRLVNINDDFDFYTADDSPSNRVPFQWAGASNSPQLQSNGGFSYVPQLVMGWVKRVLDGVNPYEARYADFYNNESPATYSSQIQIAGGPFSGSVALNSDKDVIENVGLIELYETILERARSLTIDLSQPINQFGTNQAILLAATRLAFLYELLAREAYSDAQDSTVTVTSANGLGTVAPYVHAFMNQEASLLHEELALLRGTDFVKAYPSYNRMFWNYVKGEGEAAYNANYNIYDENQDGFINEFDAAALYPQGHGDAWGHFLSANSMHYALLENNNFSWEARPELYSLLDNVIEADYLDEKSFARIAAAKARAGLEIVRGTYRLAYTEDPDGQWQGYEDVEATRAWGVSEWSKRTGQAALFDWITGQAIVPEDADVELGIEAENLEEIDRLQNRSELSEIVGSLIVIQNTLDEANSGFNPIGLDKDSLVFDIDPLQFESWDNRKTHFEQTYDKAVAAAQNALSLFEFSSGAEHDLRRIADDTLAVQIETIRQDIDYKNRLIEIFGTPHANKIGPGQPFEEGYDGPDTLLYLYVERTSAQDPDFTLAQDSRFILLTENDQNLSNGQRSIRKIESNFNNEISFNLYLGSTSRDSGTDYSSIGNVFNDYFLTASIGDDYKVAEDESPFNFTADYAFQIPDDEDWGGRSSYGLIQIQLNELLQEEIALQQAILDYNAYIETTLITARNLEDYAIKLSERSKIVEDYFISKGVFSLLSGISTAIAATAEGGLDFAWKTSSIVSEAFPRVIGFSNDATSAVRAAVRATGGAFVGAAYAAWTPAVVTEATSNLAISILDALYAADMATLKRVNELQSRVQALSTLLSQEETKRFAIVKHLQALEQKGQMLQSTIAEGFRLLDEREAYNIATAGNVQRNRYSDMIYRLSRNDAMARYQDAFNHALKYAWLTAKAYDYETSLDDGDPAAATTALEELVKTRTLGLWNGGEPRIGKGGIAEILAQLKANFDTLEGQLGINNPQLETGKLSLRHELFRIKEGSYSSDQRWQKALNDSAIRVDNLWRVPEFAQYCRPFATPEDGAQPGLVIDFGTEINFGKNVFGNELGSDDHAYSTSNYATKIRSVGVWFEGYEDAGLTTTPRIYLVPVGNDVIRLSNSDYPEERFWNVVEQRIPAPFLINDSNVEDVHFIPSVDSNNGSFADIRRFGDFRAYPANGIESINHNELTSDSRLVGRSVANTRWLLIIPGGALHADPEYGLDQFVENIQDIQLVFETYSNSGL